MKNDRIFRWFCFIWGAVFFWLYIQTYVIPRAYELFR